MEVHKLLHKLFFITFFAGKKSSSVRIELATVASEPILAEMRHFHESRTEADIIKSCKIKFWWGSWGGFTTFENVLGSLLLG